MTAGRDGIDVEEPDATLRLVLSEFARYTEYSTASPKLPTRTTLCEVNALWWQAAVDEVLDSFKETGKRDELRRNVMALVASAKRLLQDDVGTGNVAINIETGVVEADLVMQGAGTVVMSGCKIDRSVHDNRRSAFAESSSAAASRKRKGKEPAVWKDKDSDEDPPQHENTRFSAPADPIVESVDLTQVESSSSSSSSDSDSEPPVQRRRRERVSSPDELSLPAPPRRTSAPSVVIPAARRIADPSVATPSVVIPKPVIPKPGPLPRPKPRSMDALFTLQVSILRRPAITLPVYGHETLAAIIRTAWKQAPKAVRSNADTKVMVSEEHGWSGVWSDRLWADLVSAAGREVLPPVYSVVLEFEE